MVLSIRINEERDADLMLLYEYLPRGLGSLVKSILLDYFNYSNAGEVHTFKVPDLKKKPKKKKTTLVQVRLTKTEEKAIEPCLNMSERSAFIRNLIRMYMGKKLAEITKDFFNMKKNLKEVKEPREDRPIITEPVIDNEPVIENEEPKKIFEPQEY